MRNLTSCDIIFFLLFLSLSLSSHRSATTSKEKESSSTSSSQVHMPMPDLTSKPLDPNEPTYCLCQQVSFGEMIGCDNDDVSLITWVLLNKCQLTIEWCRWSFIRLCTVSIGISPFILLLKLHNYSPLLWLYFCPSFQCSIEWFHFQCVGLTSKPKGKWYCPQCS